MANKIKIQIKSRFSDSILFEYEKEDNTIKDTLVKAVQDGADLRGADLRGADLCAANLRDADLRDADLRDADFYAANLRDADLRDADLRDADFYAANLRGTDLYAADLCGADLCGANLRDANLRDTKNIPYIPFACPSDGAFIGWKKVHGRLVKLEIPEDAKRCSATTEKCRCDKAKVLAITEVDGSGYFEELENTSQAHHVVYKVGEMVYSDSFDDNRWNECSRGIHFFINKQDAINY